MRISVDFPIQRETEKSVYAEVKPENFVWLPKSACEIKSSVVKHVVSIESWLAKLLP